MLRALLTCLLLSVFTYGSSAHELQSNRMTVVQREANHLSVLLILDLPDMLHDALDPSSQPTEFLLRYAALPADTFAAEWNKVQHMVERQTRITLPSQQTIALSHWVWPSTTELQKMLQASAMQMLADPQQHPSNVTIDVHADAYAAQGITRFAVQLPALLDDVLLVHYKPQQITIPAGKKSPLRSF